MAGEQITVTIVNYNSSDFIDVSLYALDRLTKNPYKVIVVDNGSQDGDKARLKKIAGKYKNVSLIFRNQTASGSIGHGEALNILIGMIDTPYGVILDADATFLKSGWDEALISRLNDKAKIIGTAPPKNPSKPTDFPLMYAILFDTRVFKSLNINMLPEDIGSGRDVGWEMREKFLKAGYAGLTLDARNTREYKDGPFGKLICAEYYLEGEERVFASHFGRGSTLGTGKYRGGSILLNVPGIKGAIRKRMGNREKKEWIDTCRRIIDAESRSIAYDMSKHVHVRCNLCGKDDTEHVLTGKDLYNNLPGMFQVVKCKDCGFVYTNPRPFGEELMKFYPDSSGYFNPAASTAAVSGGTEPKLTRAYLSTYRGYKNDDGQGKLSLLSATVLSPFLKKNMDIEGIPYYVKDGRLLEVGCSYGLFLNRMKSLGWEVTGIEPNESAAEIGKRQMGLNIIPGTFEEAALDEKYDAIVMRMVLEHIDDPSAALKKAHDLLSDGGQLIVIVPDFSGIEFRLFSEHCYALQVPCHLNHFTPDTIRKFSEKCGFRVERIVHHRFDRDFVASAKYMKDDGSNRWLYPVLSGKLFRKTVLKMAMKALSFMGMTSRMTIIMRKVP